MTGREILNQKLKAKGLTDVQIKSKAVETTIAVLAEETDGTNYSALIQDAIQEYRVARNNADAEARRYSAKTEALSNNERANSAREQDLIKSANGIKNLLIDLEKVYDEILELETAEQRDRTRTARLFMDNVNVNTVYDNTAYIKGLSAILSGKEITPDEQSEKEKQRKSAGREANTDYQGIKGKIDKLKKVLEAVTSPYFNTSYKVNGGRWYL
jgi:hypothetical protein